MPKIHSVIEVKPKMLLIGDFKPKVIEVFGEQKVYKDIGFNILPGNPTGLLLALTYAESLGSAIITRL